MHFTKTFFLAGLLLLGLHSIAQECHYELLQKAIQNKDYDKAFEYCEMEMIEHPNNPLIYQKRAEISFSTGDYKAALLDANSAIKNNIVEDNELFASSHGLKSTIYLKMGDTLNSLAEIQEGINFYDKDPSFYYARAEIYYAKADYKKAEVDFEKTLSLDENHLDAMISLSYIKSLNKDFKTAETLLNRAVEKNPDNPICYYMRGILYIDMNRNEDAINDFFRNYAADQRDDLSRKALLKLCLKNFPLLISKINEKLNQDQDNQDWLFLRAQVYDKNNKFESAILDFSKLIEIQDESYKKYYLIFRAMCYTELAKYKLALNDLDEAILIDSSIAHAYLTSARIKTRFKDYNGALEDYNKVTVLNPDLLYVHYEIGKLYHSYLKDEKNALIEYETCITGDSEHTSAILERARIFSMNPMNNKMAIADFNSIVNIDTSAYETLNPKSFALFFLGRKDEAIKWEKYVIKTYPNADNYYQAACLFALMKKPKDAIANMKIAIEKGFRDVHEIETNHDLDGIRNEKGFVKLSTVLKEKYPVQQ